MLFSSMDFSLQNLCINMDKSRLVQPKQYFYTYDYFNAMSMGCQVQFYKQVYFLMYKVEFILSYCGFGWVLCFFRWFFPINDSAPSCFEGGFFVFELAVLPHCCFLVFNSQTYRETAPPYPATRRQCARDSD